MERDRVFAVIELQFWWVSETVKSRCKVGHIITSKDKIELWGKLIEG